MLNKFDIMICLFKHETVLFFFVRLLLYFLSIKIQFFRVFFLSAVIVPRVGEKDSVFTE